MSWVVLAGGDSPPYVGEEVEEIEYEDINQDGE
jgi:hypothetical protein